MSSFGQLIRENNQALDKTFIYEYDGMWTGKAIRFTGGAVIGAVIGGTIGGINYSPLKAASNAANRAVPSKGFNINKHLSSAGGNYNKFNLDSSDDI